jgi:hypothetical protein
MYCLSSCAYIFLFLTVIQSLNHLPLYIFVLDNKLADPTYCFCVAINCFKLIKFIVLCVHSLDVDVIVAFVNPVTIVPMDDHNLLCSTFTKSLFRLYFCHLPSNILTMYDQLTITLLSVSIISNNSQVTLKSYFPDISMKMSPFCSVLSKSVSEFPDYL